MTKNAFLSRLFSSAFVLALAACGGPEAAEIDTKSSNAVGTNCRELCRRWVSCGRDARNSGAGRVGRTFNPSATTCHNTAEDYLVQAGQSRAEYHCWRGNEAVQGPWSEVQPRYDIYRDDPSNANALVNFCASDFGID